MELKVPKIWIADDDEAIRMVLEEGLKSAGLEIATFADGELLIDALNEDKPDLIISDIKMPGMHGYDLLKHIKNNYDKLPVIILIKKKPLSPLKKPWKSIKKPSQKESLNQKSLVRHLQCRSYLDQLGS